jgi:transposase
VLKVVVLEQEGCTINEVARKMKVSRCWKEIMKKHKETGTVVERQRSGRPKATTHNTRRL